MGGDRWRHRQLPRGGRVPRGRRPRRGFPLPAARHHPEPRPHQGMAVRRAAGQGVHHQLVVRVRRGGPRGPAPLRRGDQAEIHRAAAALEVPPGRKEVHVDEGAALRRAADGSGPARAHAGRVWPRPCGGARPREGSARPAAGRPGRPVLYVGPHGGSRHRDGAARPAAVPLVRRPCRPDQGRGHPHAQRRQVGSGEMAGQGTGIRLPRRPRRLGDVGEGPMNAPAQPGKPAPAPRKQRGISLAHRVPPASGDYHWVYLWEWPIRAMHWAAAASVVLLTITGLYIGRPYFITGGEASAHYLMGWMRGLHFIAAGVFVATAIVRIYWLFAGNQFERWAALFPLRPRDWVNLYKQIKFYLMIRPDEAPRYLGHNPLQQLSYTAMYGIAAVMAATGFAMYGQSRPGGFWYVTTGWIVHLLGGIQVVHFVHHVLMWAFLIFIPIHVYLAIRADNLERTGTISSIISGGRFVSAEEHYVDE